MVRVGSTEPSVVFGILDPGSLLDLIDLALVLFSKLPRYAVAVRHRSRRQLVIRINWIYGDEPAIVLQKDLFVQGDVADSSCLQTFLERNRSVPISRRNDEKRARHLKEEFSGRGLESIRVAKDQ